jgi:hypothetical protein
MMVREFMLPYSQHMPSEATQGAVDAEIASLVGLDLLFPESSPGLGPGRMPGAAVPETAVHEDGGPELGKNEVGPDAAG